MLCPLAAPLSLPIVLAIVMIVLLGGADRRLGAAECVRRLERRSLAGLYWALLSIGTTFIGLLLAGVIIYLILSIKAINLNRRQSNFIDSVTHELKSPIASMKLCLQTLHRHQVSQQEQADFYRFMLEDLDRLDRLINQLLDAGRLESGRSQSDVEDVPLAALLAGMRERRFACAIACRPTRCDSTCSPARSSARSGRSGHHLPQPDRQRGKIRRHASRGSR